MTSMPDLSIINRLGEIRERDARDQGIPWSGPNAEEAEQFVSDRHFLVDLVGKLQEAIANLAIETYELREAVGRMQDEKRDASGGL